MAAIVSTFLLKPSSKAIHILECFIRYHISVGFRHIFLFSDGPKLNELEISQIRRKFGSDVLSVHLRGEELSALQKKYCSRFEELSSFTPTEVQARQTLNAEIAMHFAVAMNLRWLLHIDIDEIFYVNEDNSVEAHFEELDRLGVETMTYVNHEGIPEAFESDNFFLSTTLFRRHHFTIPLNSATMAAMDFWKGRTTYGQYMLVYDNGKSAARVGVGAVPRDVHRWQLPPAKRGFGQLSGSDPESPRRRCAFADGRQLCPREVLPMAVPCVLHFVTCTVDELVDKYSLLGRFPDHWFGGLLPIAPSFHLIARDVVLDASPPLESGPPRGDLVEGGHGDLVEGVHDPVRTSLVPSGTCPIREFFRKQILFSPDHFDCALLDTHSAEGGLAGNGGTGSTGGGDGDIDATVPAGGEEAWRRFFLFAEEYRKQTDSGVVMRMHRVADIMRVTAEAHHPHPPPCPQGPEGGAGGYNGGEDVPLDVGAAREMASRVAERGEGPLDLHRHRPAIPPAVSDAEPRGVGPTSAAMRGGRLHNSSLQKQKRSSGEEGGDDTSVGARPSSSFFPSVAPRMGPGVRADSSCAEMDKLQIISQATNMFLGGGW